MADSKSTFQFYVVALLSHYNILGTLITDLGCFPFDKKPYRLLSDCFAFYGTYSKFFK